MLRNNIKMGDVSTMSFPSDVTAGILPPLSAKSMRELHTFIVRSLVETGVLVVSLLVILKLLY